MAEPDPTNDHRLHGNVEEEARAYAEAIVRTVSQPLLVLGGDLTVETANPAFYRTFRSSPAETEGQRLYDIGNGQWNIPRLRDLLEQILPEQREVADFRVEHAFPEIGRRTMLLSARRMERPGRPERILVAIDDITEREHARKQLEAQKEFSDKVIDASREALLVLDTDLRVHSANETFYETFKVERDQAEGRLVYELGNGQWNIPRLRELLENVLPDNDSFNDFGVEHDFEDIGHRVMLLNARRVDHLQLILVAIEDMTERQRSEQRFRKAMDIETVGMIFWDQEIRIVDCNDAFFRMSGYDRGEIAGLHWADLTPPEFYAASENAVAQIREHGLATPYVKQYIRKDGSRWWGLFAPRRLSEHETVEFVLDITERVQAEDQRDLLLAELNHRVKNMFAVIRAIAMQGNGRRTAAEFRDIFLGRLDALVRAHNLVFEGEWRSVPLDELARAALKAYAITTTDSVTIDGPPVKVAPKRALSLSLVLHELATNAAKYGALSTPEGQIHLSWKAVNQEAEPTVHMEWSESGGPAVHATPEGGFGTRLINRIFDYELGGEVALDFAPNGLRLRATFRPT
ncbi:Chemotaxis protein methyltransferase CheR [Caenispirillum salinarum AK4]|uniref:histidine kinase n=1 Tax=Caenispirillum salinarum AK4 TaxID=1238182 RepID=K9GLP8_9PROT|nr:PAS domain-containing protein [Caenispirillum salinarum]EKV25977.1 Chemotaxis protein methyltransferase CheR [Caenispirillum salinarum AK4]